MTVPRYDLGQLPHFRRTGTNHRPPLSLRGALAPWQSASFRPQGVRAARCAAGQEMPPWGVPPGEGSFCSVGEVTGMMMGFLFLGQNGIMNSQLQITNDKLRFPPFVICNMLIDLNQQTSNAYKPPSLSLRGRRPRQSPALGCDDRCTN